MNSPTPATNPITIGITLGIATLALIVAAWLCGSFIPIA